MGKLFSICLCVLIIACTPPLVLKNSIYVSNCCNDRMLTLIPLTLSAISISKPDDFRKVFKKDARDPKMIVQDSAYSVMSNRLKRLTNIHFDTTRFSNIFFNSPSDSICDVVNYNIRKDRLPYTFYIPKQEALKSKIDIGLVISDISFSEQAGSVGSPIGKVGGMMMWDGDNNPKLSSTVTFIIWDYINWQPVCYGQFNVEKRIVFLMNRKIWFLQFEQIIEKIISNSPFNLS